MKRLYSANWIWKKSSSNSVWETGWNWWNAKCTNTAFLSVSCSLPLRQTQMHPVHQFLGQASRKVQKSAFCNCWCKAGLQIRPQCERERERWRRPNSFGINAYLSSYGNQHLNDNECLRAALKELSYSAHSPFETLLRCCRSHLVYSLGGHFNRHFGASLNRRRYALYKSSGRGPGAAHLWKKLPLYFRQRELGDYKI